MSIEAKFASASEASKNGWFSRRHQDSGPHFAARQKWLANKAYQRQRASEELGKALERKEAAKANATTK